MTGVLFAVTVAAVLSMVFVFIDVPMWVEGLAVVVAIWIVLRLSLRLGVEVEGLGGTKK